MTICIHSLSKNLGHWNILTIAMSNSKARHFFSFLLLSIFAGWLAPSISAQYICTDVADPDDNVFTCQAGLATDNQWRPTGQDYCNLDSEPDDTTCGGAETYGSGPGEKWLCGEGNTSCCLPCRPIIPPDGPLIFYWGSSCNPNADPLDEVCEPNTECRDGSDGGGPRCLSTVTINDGGLCEDTSECQAGDFVCQANSAGIKTCTPNQPANYCQNDTECTSPEICNLAINRCELPDANNCRNDSECESQVGVGSRCDQATGVCTASIFQRDFCKQAGPVGSDFYQKCESCIATGVWTAFGCIDYTQQGIVTSLSRLGVGLGGGIALILVLYGSFTISTSTSNPQRLQNGQQILISALVGLFFMILSVVMLQFMGVEILRIPGF